jgi:hypothetical protein
MNTLPKAFVGSSSESLNIAYEIQAQLDGTAIVQPWKGLIGLGAYVLDALMEQMYDFDFGIFVFAADDMVEIRGENYLAARDNIILEAGLFLERLGRKRTLLVVQDVKPKVHLPSDLAGLTVASFSLPQNMKPDAAEPPVIRQALGTACNEIRNAIKTHQTHEPSEVLSGGMVYLLRHLEDQGYNIRDLTRILVHIQIEKEYDQLSDGEKKGWEKAAQYACLCLQALDLIEPYGTIDYGITPGGRRLLASSKLRHRFAKEFKAEKMSLYRSTSR